VDMYCANSVSEIMNNEVEIRIQYFMDCEARTPMGVCPYVCSRQQILLQRYLIRNTSPNPLYDVAFFQMLIGHPMCSEWGDWGVFDPTPYANTLCPFYEDYRFDITLWGDAYNPEVCWEYMNFATHAPFNPEDGDAWDVDECLAIIQKVENDALMNPPACQPVGPDFLGGALKWKIGTMDQSQEVVIDVILTIGFQECCPTGVENEFGERTTWGCIKSLYR
jgi:hypothetical protein